jgi:hypothetical protein
MKMECLTTADEYHLVPSHTATGFPICTQCERTLVLHRRLLESTQFAPTPSTPYCQTIPQDLQSPFPSDQLSYPMIGPDSFEAGLMVYAATEYNDYCLFGPFIQAPICWGDASFTCAQASWVEYERQSVGSVTTNLPCIYSTPLSSIEGELVQTSGSPDNAGSSKWDACDSDSDETGSVESLDDNAVAGLTGSHRSRKAQESMRTTPPACSEKRIDLTPYPAYKPFECQLKAQGPQEKEVCGRRFVRIEHLRRHMSTVHSTLRTKCKVPLCRKSFSRCDNLYDHYWTHVDLGKTGRNLKLSMEQLKQILWPRDRRIFRILKSRMNRPRRPSERDRRRRHNSITVSE